MTPRSLLVFAVIACAVGALFWVVLCPAYAVAAPPPGGLGSDCVVRSEDPYGSCLWYRFRDGPRVCYWRFYEGSHEAATAISCVVSP